MNLKKRQVTFENGLLNELRKTAEPLDEPTREELRKLVELNKSGDTKLKRSRFAEADLSAITIEIN